MAKHPVLVKLEHSAGPSGVAATAGLQKLFDVARPPAGPAAAPVGPLAWYRVEVDTDAAGAAAADQHPWDAAHAAAFSGAAGLAGGTVLAAEPDLLQAAYPDVPPAAAHAAAAPNDPAPQKGSPYVPCAGFAWHLDDQHSGLRSARDALKVATSPIKVVHLDTGWDPSHNARPANVVQQANFVEGGADAFDRTPPGGVLHNGGHGTGTIGILAGQALLAMRPGDAEGVLGGAAPMQIVPVRIANSVVHFWTSAVAQGIDFARSIGADVVSMSMGGLPSAAWADAVNAAYDAGLVVVCAAGNNFGGLPTSLTVYPARFNRVVSACGAMADGHPYYGLPVSAMAGNAGPAGKMQTSVAAFTPNIPWARFGIPDLIDCDGGGTSAATPQVAAAAALWMHRNGARYQGWQRAEAARQALFRTADRGAGDETHLGRGLLRARAALECLPDAAGLQAVPPDNGHFAFLHLLTGALGVAEQGFDAVRGAMLALECTQLALRNTAAQQAIADPDRPATDVTEAERTRFLEALLDVGGSRTLQAHLRRLLRRPGLAVPKAAPPKRPALGRRILETPPPARRLQIFATDPGDGRRLKTAFINTATVSIPWEQGKDAPNLLEPGPVGDYLEVVDVDPASGAVYPPVDLNHPFLLAQDGLAPSEGNPKFHQQMVYAVAMRTIKHFEVALGRRVL